MHAMHTLTALFSMFLGSTFPGSTLPDRHPDGALRQDPAAAPKVQTATFAVG